MAGAKITLKEAQAIAYLLEYGRWRDPGTGEFMEERTSQWCSTTCSQRGSAT
jgi:hypothetical protein